MLKLNKNMQIIIMMLILLILLDGSLAGMRALSSLSYSTGYQGARAQFAGVSYGGKQYTLSQKHDASIATFDTTLGFDPDGTYTGKPNLVGEMTSVFIPSESLSNFPSWIPNEWVREASYINNPTSAWEWEINDKLYRIEEWTLRWYFSISAEWDNPPWIYEPNKEWIDQRYSNTEIWFSIDLTPVWYFEGAERAYFAIAKAQLADVRKSARDNNGDIVEARTGMSVRPESQGSILPIYYGLFAKQNDAQKTPTAYQGKQLNPDLFTDKVYTYFTLENFGTLWWTVYTPMPEKRYKGDVVTVAVDIHIFVIGQWDIKDIQSLEQIEGDEGYGRTAKVGGATSWLDFLKFPETRLLMVLLGALVVFLILAIFAPWVLIAIFGMLGGRRRR